MLQIEPWDLKSPCPLHHIIFLLVTVSCSTAMQCLTSTLDPVINFTAFLWSGSMISGSSSVKKSMKMQPTCTAVLDRRESAQRHCTVTLCCTYSVTSPAQHPIHNTTSHAPIIMSTSTALPSPTATSTTIHTSLLLGPGENCDGNLRIMRFAVKKCIICGNYVKWCDSESTE